MTERICPACNATFVPRRNARYRSRRCLTARSSWSWPVSMARTQRGQHYRETILAKR